MLQTSDGRYLPTQRENEYSDEQERRTAPWTKRDLERVRTAALALIRTHVSWDRADGTIRPSFDGNAYWRLLGALDRTNTRGE